MTYIIQATQVVLEENIEENYRMAAFADRGDDPNNYLIMQRAIEFDDQDIDLEMDGHYIELNNQGNSGHKVCKSASFDGKRLALVFHKDCGIEPLEVFVDLSAAQFEQGLLEKCLKFIFNEIYRDA